MMKKRKAFFDDIARQWDEEHNTPEEMARTREFAGTYFPVTKGEAVLDVGCGTSRLVPSLKEAIGDRGRLIEMDISVEMLRIGKKRYPFPGLLFLQGDGHGLPIKDHCLDAVVCFAFFPHLSDKAVAMADFSRVLKPGGRLTIAHQMNREELNRFHGNVDGPVSNDLLPDEAGMRALFKTAGFSNLEVREAPGLYLASAIRA